MPPRASKGLQGGRGAKTTPLRTGRTSALGTLGHVIGQGAGTVL